MPDEENKYTITFENTHEPEPVKLTVKKVWEDSVDGVENAYGIRPESLTVTLTATVDGETIAVSGIDDSAADTEYTLNKDNGWSAETIELPKCKEGKEIVYTWTENESELLPCYRLENISTEGLVTTLTNILEYGDLTISKQVISSNAADQDQTFTFTIQLVDGDKPIKVTATIDGVQFTDGTTQITITGTGSRTIKGLPARAGYKVVEAEADQNHFKTTYNGDEGTIGANGTSNAVITNRKLEGGLAVTKRVVSGLEADHERKFSFQVTLTGETIADGTYGDMQFKNNKAEFELADGESATAAGLPEGIGYTVTETGTDADGFAFNVKYNGTVDGSIKANATQHANITNTRKTGKLQLKKTVTNPTLAAATEVYKFTVELTYTEDEKTETLNGTYGGYTFEGGKTVVGLRNGETVTISQIPIGTEYKVEEKFAEGDDRFTVELINANGMITEEGKTVEAEIRNTRKTNDLPISKTVVSPIEADQEKEFTFTIQLSEKITDTENIKEVNDKTGEEKVMPFTGGKGTITVTGNESKTIKGLPEGVSYTITEKKEAYFNEANDKATQDGEINGEDVAFTNEREKGGLDVTKIVKSTNEEDSDREFNFTVELTLDGKPLSGDFGGATFDEDGKYTFTLKDGETREFADMPAGIGYTVTEEDYENEGFFTVKTGETGTIVKENVAEARFINVKDEGGLVVSKKVKSSLTADHEKKFTFQVTLDDEEISGTFGEVIFSEGVSEEFKLTDGEFVVISGLPAGVGYTVTETDGDGNIYSYSDVTGTIEMGKAQHATIVNERLTGELTIEKEVESPTEEDNEQLFGFTVTLSNGDEKLNGKYGGYTFEDGEVQIWLKAGESKTIRQIPVGTHFQITEDPSDLYQVTMKIEGIGVKADEEADESVEGDITEADQKISVIVTNERKLGDLVIRKTFTGIPEGSKEITKNLKFRVYGPYGLVGDVTYGEFDKDGTYTFRNLPTGEYAVYELNAYGLSGTWMLQKASVTSGEATVAAGKQARVELKNSYKIPTTSVTIMKVWDDEDNLEGARPKKLTVTLLRNGEEVTTVVLNDGNNWMAEITDLPLYDANENEYVYTWQEEEVDGYELVSTEVIGNFTELTNRHEPKLISVKVKKVWYDNQNKNKLRPLSLAVSLYCGDTVVKTVILTADNGWSATVSDLPAIIDGKEAKYTWKEQEVLGYRANYKVDESGMVTTITNTYNTNNTDKHTEEIDEYDTPLGIEIVINHVGDSYE